MRGEVKKPFRFTAATTLFFAFMATTDKNAPSHKTNSDSHVNSPGVVVCGYQGVKNNRLIFTF